MTAHVRRRVLASLSIGALLSLAFGLFTIAACSSSKSKETPEQVAEAGLAAYQADIRRVVKDPVRADQLVELSTEFQRLVEECSRSFAHYHARVTALNANYGATLAEFEALFDQQDKERAELLERAVSLRTRMAALTTDAEWAALKKARVAEWQDELAQVQS